MLNIVLAHPRIPQNVGAIGRLCVNGGFKLHIIKPIIFDLDEKKVKRAGLDYWQKLNPKIWNSDEDFINANLEFKDRFFFCTTKGEKTYFDANFKENDFLIFGSESFGLPPIFMNFNKKNNIKIPMTKDGRSLNLAIAVGIISYEALRQNYNLWIKNA